MNKLLFGCCRKFIDPHLTTLFNIYMCSGVERPSIARLFWFVEALFTRTLNKVLQQTKKEIISSCSAMTGVIIYQGNDFDIDFY